MDSRKPSWDDEQAAQHLAECVREYREAVREARAGKLKLADPRLLTASRPSVQ